VLIGEVRTNGRTFGDRVDTDADRIVTGLEALTVAWSADVLAHEDLVVGGQRKCRSRHSAPGHRPRSAHRAAKGKRCPSVSAHVVLPPISVRAPGNYLDDELRSRNGDKYATKW